MAKKENLFIKVTATSGILLMVMSFAIFMFNNNGFMGEIHSEIFGVGVGLLVLGIASKLYGIKF